MHVCSELILLTVAALVLAAAEESVVPPLNGRIDHNEEASVSSSITQQCTMGEDSSCSAKADIYEAIKLPAVNEDGFLKIGYGDPQQVSGENQAEVLLRVKQMVHYMRYTVEQNDHFDAVRRHCLNRNELCAYWATVGECTANPAYMQLNCAAACLSCEQLAFETRCPLLENLEETNIWKPGSLNQMFERIVRNYPTTTILARPATPHELVEDRPWVIMVDDFLTNEECDGLVELGAQSGYERSEDVGELKFDGTYDSEIGDGRTSTNTWCLEACYDDPRTRGVIRKLEQLTGIPDANAEYLQLLRYEVGQYYHSHHDYIPHHVERNQGVRILTAFLYLNDVEEGGGTRFTDLELTCQPKKGRALLWASVLDEEPNRDDNRTHHEALPVEKGIKYAANAWFHQRDFKITYAANCI
jgi:prolyl 4-hydroxylase